MSNANLIEPTTGQTQRPLIELPEDLFPLPITAFERMMLDDDSRNYPRTFTVVIELDGCLVQAAFEEAMLQVVQRNPLLRSILRKVRSKWNWDLTQFPPDQIVWGVPLWEVENVPFNLKKRPGFRASGRSIGTKSEVRLVFHHAVCDGQGARRVILDWLTIYAGIVSPDVKPAPLDSLNYHRLNQRGDFSCDPGPPKEAAVAAPPPTLSQRIKIIYDFISKQPVPVRSASLDSGGTPGGQPHMLMSSFDQHDVDRFRDRLRGSRIRLNDVAIAVLLNSIARWNEMHGEKNKQRHYRILVPADLREMADENLPAANRMSFVFITRPASVCLDWQRLLETIRDEMSYIDNHGSKYNLVRVLPLIQSIPGLVPIGVRLPLCLSTAVMTNLGNTWRRLRHRFPDEDGRPVIGNLRFVRAGGAPPLRQNTRLGIGLTISLGEIAVHSQFDSRVFSRTDAETFMKLFNDNWMNWADDGPTVL